MLEKDPRIRKLVLACAALALVPLVAPAQVPTAPRVAKCEAVEVRGLDAVPASAEHGFAGGAARAPFGEGTRAAVARFRVPSPPEGAQFTLAWSRSGTGAEPVQLLATRVERRDLAAGLYSLLTNEGEPLVPGRYQVSIGGADGRLICVAEFAVAGQPPPEPAGHAPGEAAAPDVVAIPYARYRLGRVSFDYPTSYTAQPLTSFGGSAVVLGSPRASAFLVVAETEERSSLEKVTDDVRSGMISSLGQLGQGFLNWKSYNLPAGTIGGRRSAGRMLVARHQGISCQFVFHLVEVDRRNVVLGYAVFQPVTEHASEVVVGRLTGLDEVTDAYFRLGESLRPEGPPD